MRAYPIVQPVGKSYVATEHGDILNTRQSGGNRIALTNGEWLPVQRYWSSSAIATGASDTTIIAAPADAQHKIVVLAYTVMCDAATLVTFRSNSTTIGMPLPIAANGGITRPGTGRPLMVAVAGQPLAITTSGGNTYLDIDYVVVPISADIL